MVYLSSCPLVFLCFAITQIGESLAWGDVIFQKSEQTYLANHVMETIHMDSEMKCGLHCAENKSCTSINYKTSGSDKGRCELNNKTVEETSDVDDKKRDPEYIHLEVIERVSIQLFYTDLCTLLFQLLTLL